MDALTNKRIRVADGSDHNQLRAVAAASASQHPPRPGRDGTGRRTDARARRGRRPGRQEDGEPEAVICARASPAGVVIVVLRFIHSLFHFGSPHYPSSTTLLGVQNSVLYKMTCGKLCCFCSWRSGVATTDVREEKRPGVVGVAAAISRFSGRRSSYRL